MARYEIWYEFLITQAKNNSLPRNSISDKFGNIYESKKDIPFRRSFLKFCEPLKGLIRYRCLFDQLFRLLYTSVNSTLYAGIKWVQRGPKEITTNKFSILGILVIIFQALGVFSLKGKVIA